MLQLRAPSLAATHEIAAAIAGVARVGDVIVLAGEMGSGKTAFAQGFGAALGVDDPILSPTFTLVHSHPTRHGTSRVTLHHADLYRLSTQHEVADLALAELAEADGIVLVEWGDVVSSAWGDHLLLRFEPVDGDEGARDVHLSAFGRSWAARWARLEAALRPWAASSGGVSC